MFETMPLAWMLIGFNVPVLAIFVYRRISERPPFSRSLAALTQISVIVVNCMIPFRDDILRYISYYAGN